MSGRNDSYRPGSGVKDVDRERARERERQEQIRAEERDAEGDKPKSEMDPVAEYKRLMDLRSGGRYVPPAKLRALQEAMAASQSPKDFQRIEWEKLKKSVNRLINQVNVSNIREVVRNVFSHNLIRGRGIFVRSIMKAQAASLTYTNVYATLAAIVNSKLPQIGELLVTRLVIQFRRAFRRNNKAACISSSMFLAHLCNHQVAHEVVCLQILHLLLEKPTNDSVEIAVGFMRQIGAYLSEFSPAAATGVFERFRAILHEGNVETRVQYMIEVLFQVRKEGYKDHPVISEGLDLVEEDDQITHMIGLDDTGLKGEDGLNVFQFDNNYEENEQKYNRVKEEILGDDDEEQDEEESGSSSDEEEEEKKVETETDGKVVIKDMTNTELVNLRKTIYLTIMSTMSIQEITHKLLKINVPEGNESEVVNMLIECCAQEKIYNKIYGGVCTHLCRLRRDWHDLFKEAFKDYYEKIHRYQTLRIRNIATLFGYLLASDGLSWEVFEAVYISEEHTTSSSRIFIKFLFEEMQQEIGVKQLKERFSEEFIQPYTKTLFPKTTREETMFAINFFTVLHLGPLTDDMREYLESLPPPSPPRRGRSTSRSSRSGSYSSRSRSGSYGSRSRSKGRGRSYSSRSSRSRSYSSRSSRSRSYSSRSRSRGRSYSRRGRSYSQTPSYSRSRSRSYSRTPSRSRSRSHGRGRRRSYSRSPRRYSQRSRSVSNSRSPSPRRGRRRSRSEDSRTPSHSPKRRSPPPRKDYTPPPQRPRNWEEARKRNRSTSPSQPSSTQSKRPKAADYL